MTHFKRGIEKVCNPHLPKALDYTEDQLDTIEDNCVWALIAECANWHSDQDAMFELIFSPPARAEWKTLVTAEIDNVTYIVRRLVEVR
jgi:hypothetical protein